MPTAGMADEQQLESLVQDSIETFLRGCRALVEEQAALGR